MVEAVTCEPSQAENSLLTGNLTGKCAEIAVGGRKKGRFRKGLLAHFPAQPNRAENRHFRDYANREQARVRFWSCVRAASPQPKCPRPEKTRAAPSRTRARKGDRRGLSAPSSTSATPIVPKPRCAGADLDDLLRQANGRTVDLGERRGALDTAGLAVVAIESKWRAWLPAADELCRRRARRARHRALDRGGVHALLRRAQALLVRASGQNHVHVEEWRAGAEAPIAESEPSAALVGQFGRLWPWRVNPGPI